MELRLQVRMIPRILAMHMMRQRWQRALWMKGLLLLEKASVSILVTPLPPPRRREGTRHGTGTP